MKKIVLAIALLSAPLLVFSQARLVIVGTSTLTIVENGGTSATPIYIEIGNGAANAITTSGSKGWIISESEFNMVKWDIGTATGAYTVPFGYGTTYSIPLALTIGTAGTGTGSILFSTYHTIADQLNGTTSVTGDPSDVKNMYPAFLPGSPSNTDNSYNAVDRFWIMDAGKFAYTSNPVLSSVTFNYIHAGLPEFASPNTVADESDLIAQRFNSTLSTWGDWEGSGTYAASGNIGTVSNTSSVTAANFFRSWTLSNSISPLPITLTSFTAQCDNNKALIQWTSQTELNNDYYTVEKTTDDVHFETVATINGAGTTSFPSNYSITDPTPSEGESYYELYQTDFDGVKRKIGDPVMYTGCGTTAATKISTYSTANTIQVNINAVSSGNFDIVLTNLMGQVMYSGNHAVSLGNNSFMLPNNVAQGIYVLSVRNDEINYTQKILMGVR